MASAVRDITLEIIELATAIDQTYDVSKMNSIGIKCEQSTAHKLECKQNV